MLYPYKNIGSRNNLWGFLFLILSLVSCNDKTDADFSTPNLKESLFLDLKIIHSSELTTKADSDGFNDHGSEEGSYLENYIDIENNDFHIVIFNSSGNFITEFEGEEIGFKEENNDIHTHLLGIEIKDEKLKDFPSNYGSEEFTVVILANWKSYSGLEYASFKGKNLNNIGTQDDFYDFSYTLNSEISWSPSLEESNKRLIPMMGIRKFTGFAYSPDKGMPAAWVTIPMLRSLAKITLSLTDALWKSGFEIESCKLNKFASKGKVIPDLSKNENTWGGEGNIHISVPWKSEEKTGPLSFVKIGEGNSNKILTAYVPEMDTSDYDTSTEGRPLLFASLTLNEQQFKDEKSFEFNDNEEGSTNLFHILRNHHYNFIIEDISGEENITIKYTVCPWVEGSTDIAFH